jgi:hypothetical protein
MTSLDDLSGGGGARDGGVEGSAVTPGGGSGGSSGGSGGSSGGAPIGDAAGDDGASSDGGSDAGVDAADAGWCGTQGALLFCDDFDHGPLAAPFDRVSNTNGVVALTSGLAVSPPNAMAVTTVGSRPSYDCAAYLAFPKLAGVKSVFTLSFDVQIVSADKSNNSDAVLAAIQMFDTGVLYDLQLEAYYDSTAGALDINFSEDSDPQDGGKNLYTSHAVNGATLAFNAWNRVTIELTLNNPVGSAGGNTAKISMNGNVLASVLVNVSATNGTPELIVGLPFVQPNNQSWVVRFDDVTFDARPL